MKFEHCLRRGLLLLLLLPFANLGHAADANAVGNVEEIVVTGSYIKGSPEDAALPVDVITRTDLEDVGQPSMIEFIRSLGISSGNLGETNQFNSPGQGTEGVTSVNLRGLGASRTLTLINGRRQVATENNGVDLSAFPQVVFARTEVLKDGAAALYGSDAIAGVANFITRSGFEGLEVSGSNTWIEESDGNHDASIIYGFASDSWNWMAAAEYDHRSELQIRDKDWALRPLAENVLGGWSFTGQPGTPVRANLDGTRTTLGVDNNCVPLGGANALPVLGAGLCGFQFTYFDNLIEETDTYKGYTEFNYDVSEHSKLHVEAMYSYLDMPEWKTSPAYPPQALFGPAQLIAPTHPGLISYKAQNPTNVNTGLPIFTDQPGYPIAAQSVYERSRYLGVNGFFGEPQEGYREADTWRLATSLIGDAFDDVLGYNFGISYSERKRKVNGFDMGVEKMAFALKGLGGPGCTPGGAAATSTPGVGPCEYFNPFPNAINRSVVTGLTNPNFDPTVANSADMTRWLIYEGESTEESKLLVFDAVFNGELDFLTLPGGPVGWAAGIQTRNEKYTVDYNAVSDRQVNPCPYTNPYAVTLGLVAASQLGPNCTVRTGLLAFGSANDAVDTSRTVYAAFSEFALPITDTVDMQAAVRFEDYGANGGSTIDPKVAIRWQAMDWLALRGSISTSFRGPPQSYLEGTNTVLQNINNAGAYKAVDIIGNPNLDPETATVGNVGLIFEAGGFNATVDYWSFKFSDPFQTESAGQLVSAYQTGLCADGQANVATPRCGDLRTHIFPVGTLVSNLERVDTNIINGSDIDTSGVDVASQYRFDLMGGEMTVGAEGTYTIEYKSDAFADIGGTVLAPGGDFVGFMNTGLNPFTPLPDLKGNVFARFARDNWRFSYTVRYIADYEQLDAVPDSLSDVDAMTTQDVTAIYTWHDLTIAGSVFNLTDEDPPFVSQALSYDAYTHNAFGRMMKLDFTYTLGGK